VDGDGLPGELEAALVEVVGDGGTDRQVHGDGHEVVLAAQLLVSCSIKYFSFLIFLKSKISLEV
jgi:hypothetical protein